MSAEHLTYTARLPRHPVVDTAPLEISVFTPHDDISQPVELLDFSRQGMRFRCASRFTSGTPIHVRLRLGTDERLEWRFPAHVRWVSPGETGACSYGCEFVETVTWEQLGELLLHGVLAPE